MTISRQEVVRLRRLVSLASTRLREAEVRTAEVANAISIAQAEMTQIDAVFDAWGTTSDSRMEPLVLAAASRRRRVLQGISDRLEQTRGAIAQECAILRAQLELHSERSVAAQRRYEEHQEQADISEFVSSQLGTATLGQVQRTKGTGGLRDDGRLEGMAREAGERDGWLGQSTNEILLGPVKPYR